MKRPYAPRMRRAVFVVAAIAAASAPAGGAPRPAPHWIGGWPLFEFAVTDAHAPKGVRPFGDSSGDFSMRSGTPLVALDAWGAPAGRAVMLPVNQGTSSASGVWSPIAVRILSGNAGAGLYVSDAPAATAAAAPWTPSATERAGFAALSRGAPVFFRVLAPRRGAPERFGIACGRTLVVGYLDASGAWITAYVRSARGHVFDSEAVLDMNGDGMPEIVIREGTRAGEGEPIALVARRGGRGWTRAAWFIDNGP